jgi:hypothetical protein
VAVQTINKQKYSLQQEMGLVEYTAGLMKAKNVDRVRRNIRCLLT